MQGDRVQGQFVTVDGKEEYSGQWKNDQRHGTGVQYRAGICKYEGSWKDDLQHGQGSCEWIDGSRYDGEWQNGNRSGKGRYTTATGMKYEGAWLDDMPHGQGICVEDTGDKYTGAFFKGKRHGFGRCVYYSVDSTARDGGSGTSTTTKSSRTKYEGEWQNGKRHGQGTCAYANGDVYIGTWQNDHRHGYGICKFSDGSKFQGQWEDDGWVQSGADPMKCYVAGAGVTRGVAGKKAGFKILARDEDGNQRLSGGDEFSVQLVLVQENEDYEEINCIPPASSAAASAAETTTTTTTTTLSAVPHHPPQKVHHMVSVTGEVKDNYDGTYEITYTATTAGIYELNITLGGGLEHVADSPYPVRIVPAKPYSRNTVVQGQGRSHAVVNTTTQFEIVLLDKYGNQCTGAAPSSSSLSPSSSSSPSQSFKFSEIPLEAYLEGAGAGPMNANKIQVDFDFGANQDDALFCCYVAPALPGYYRLHVEWDGKALPGTPYSVSVVATEADLGLRDIVSGSTTKRTGSNVLSEGEEEERLGDDAATTTTPATTFTKTPVIRDEMAAWERIAAAAYATDGVTEGWDSEDDEIKKKTTSEETYINSHPDVPVVENLEDLWLVSKLQKERKAKEEDQKRKKLESVREKLEGEFGPGQVPTAEEAEVALKEILKEEKEKEQVKEKDGAILIDTSVDKYVVDAAPTNEKKLSRAELLAAAAELDDIC